MPGPASIKGTPADSSYSVDFPHRPRAPRLSPWSLVYKTRVLSDRPAASSAASTWPICSSMKDTRPLYPAIARRTSASL